MNREGDLVSSVGATYLSPLCGSAIGYVLANTRPGGRAYALSPALRAI